LIGSEDIVFGGVLILVAENLLKPLGPNAAYQKMKEVWAFLTSTNKMKVFF
jgi:hypothetical protein